MKHNQVQECFLKLLTLNLPAKIKITTRLQEREGYYIDIPKTFTCDNYKITKKFITFYKTHPLQQTTTPTNRAIPQDVPPVNPDWKTDTVTNLFKTLKAKADFSIAPILADALQDANCNEPIILNHLRQDAQPGSWFLPYFQIPNITEINSWRFMDEPIYENFGYEPALCRYLYDKQIKNYKTWDIDKLFREQAGTSDTLLHHTLTASDASTDAEFALWQNNKLNFQDLYRIIILRQRHL